MIESMVGWKDLEQIEYVLSVGWIESQNTYFEASGHTYDFGLHKNVVSSKPVPQQPLFTSSKPTFKIVLLSALIHMNTDKTYKTWHAHCTWVKTKKFSNMN